MTRMTIFRYSCLQWSFGGYSCALGRKIGINHFQRDNVTSRHSPTEPGQKRKCFLHLFIYPGGKICDKKTPISLESLLTGRDIQLCKNSLNYVL